VRERFAYDPALDGLRAIAVLVVMAYHAELAWASGGFLGVDLFFVLSGFLITTLLLRELATTGRVDLVGFWTRRLRRLVPALALMVVWVMVYGRWIDPSSADSGVRADAVASLLYVANWWQIVSDTSYFGLLASPTPLLHTWSLAIEEQWYLVWPLVLAGWFRWRSGASDAGGLLKAALVLAGLALASAVLMAAVADRADPSRAFFGTDTRSAGLLIGASLAFILESGPLRAAAGRQRSFPLTLGALLAFVAAVTSISEDDFFMYSGGFLAASLVCGLIVFGLRLAGPDDPLRRALSARPLVGIGKLSYGLYLWHWPVFVWLTEDSTGLDGISLVALRVVATAVPSVASYWLVEQPIRQSRLPAFGPVPLAVGAGVLALLALVVLPAPRQGDIGQAIRITADDATGALAIPTTADTSPSSPPAQSSTMTQLPVDVVPSTTLGLTPVEASAPTTGPPPTAPERASMLILGDSVYLDLVMGVRWPRSTAAGTSVVPTADVRLGCGTLRYGLNPTCDDRLTSWRQSVVDDDPDVVVIGVSSWDVLDVDVNGLILELGSEVHTEMLVESWQDNLDAVTSTGAAVLVVGLPCLALDNAPDSTAAQRVDPARTAFVNRTIAGVVDSYQGQAYSGQVRWVELRDLTCPDGQYRETLRGVRQHRDGIHFADEAIPVVWEWLIEPVGVAVTR
jgi:peptidoglycan/LPS O-acetylase OafA/YrhL